MCNGFTAIRRWGSQLHAGMLRSIGLDTTALEHLGLDGHAVQRLSWPTDRWQALFGMAPYAVAECRPDVSTAKGDSEYPYAEASIRFVTHPRIAQAALVSAGGGALTGSAGMEGEPVRLKHLKL